MVGPVIVRFDDDIFGAMMLWEELVLVGRVTLSTLAWRHSTQHTIGQYMPEKDLTVASGNRSDQVQTCGIRGGQESKERTLENIASSVFHTKMRKLSSEEERVRVRYPEGPNTELKSITASSRLVLTPFSALFKPALTLFSTPIPVTSQWEEASVFMCHAVQVNPCRGQGRTSDWKTDCELTS